MNLQSNNGGSLDHSLAEKPFSLVLPEPIFGGQYVYGCVWISSDLEYTLLLGSLMVLLNCSCIS